MWYECLLCRMLYNIIWFRCYARLHPRAVNCRKKKCGHSNQVLVLPLFIFLHYEYNYCVLSWLICDLWFFLQLRPKKKIKWSVFFTTNLFIYVFFSLKDISSVLTQTLFQWILIIKDCCLVNLFIFGFFSFYKFHPSIVVFSLLIVVLVFISILFSCSFS